MDRFLTISLIVLVAGTVINSLEFEEERRNYSNEFEDWRHDIRGVQPWTQRLRPKSATRRTAENENDSSEERVTNSPSLDVDSISGTIGGNGGGGEIEVDTHRKPVGSNSGVDTSDFDGINAFLPPQSLNPFFGNPFFNFFGNHAGGAFPEFGFGEPQNIPWWKGPNVCTERKEELSDWNTSSNSGDEMGAGVGEQSLRQTQNIHYGIHISLNTCVEKTNKRVCTTIVNEGGKKKTISVTHQCCRGYGRRQNSRSANIRMPCEELNLRSLIETSEKLEGREFIRSAQKNDVDESLRKNVTLFLPTDTTFTEFAEQMLESNLVVLPASRNRRAVDVAGITTKDLILNHVVPEVINIEDIENEQLLVTEYKNATIRMNIFPRPPGMGRDDDDNQYSYRYTANCAPLVKVNQEAENGIVHVIDRVLTPVTKTIMELLRERNDMAVMQTVLEKTDLAKQLANADKQFTLFAPNDKAFEKLEPHLRRTIKEGKGCALNILKNHILEMTFCSVAVVDDAKTSAINLLGEKMNLERVNATRKEASNALSEAEDLAATKSIEINGKAHVIESDIMATNGVVHIVDTLLPTESAMPVSSLMDSRNLTVFKKLIELNGFDDMIDSFENVSIFAPTDVALATNYWASKIETEPESLKGNEELSKFIKYHIAKPLIKTCDLTEQSLDTESGNKVRINLYSTHTVFSNVFNRATVNCARLVHFDDDSCGSVLHQIDRPLEAPSQTLLEALETNPQYSMFVDLIKGANLTDMLSDTNRSLTILVPKNDIFTEVQEFFDELRMEQNRAKLERIIKSHIIDDVLCCAGIVPSEWPFVRLVKTINDVDLRLSRDRRPKIQNAGVTKCDIIATNGIIHEINDVISTKQQRRTAGGTRVSSSESSEEDAPVLRKHQFPFMPDFLSFP